jgi:nicotinamide-nucleotide adenylyltransferase
MTTALFIGRFQPFHLGHMSVVTRILKEHDSLMILVGSPGLSRTKDDPLTARERIRLIRGCVGPGPAIRIMPDHESNEVWKSLVMALRFDAVYTGNRLVKRLLSGRKVIGLSRYRHISSTDIRKRFRNNKAWKHLVPPGFDYRSFEKAMRSSS